MGGSSAFTQSNIATAVPTISIHQHFSKRPPESYEHTLLMTRYIHTTPTLLLAMNISHYNFHKCIFLKASSISSRFREYSFRYISDTSFPEATFPPIGSITLIAPRHGKPPAAGPDAKEVFSGGETQERMAGRQPFRSHFWLSTVRKDL
ncbi:MAG TPA: hypothetical protein VM661_02910 [Candidatus Sulfotelmatobacter sp.]|nr:hypothetical protein [Candidatus Sulfotelmatobacter sp.]